MNLEPEQYKKLTRYIWVFLIVSFISMALHGLRLVYFKFNPKSPAEIVQQHAKDPYKITKHVRVSGVDYDIPVGYFADMVPYATEDLNIYLIVMRPDFTILPKSESKLWHEGRQGEVLRILADDPKHIKNMDYKAKFIFKQTGYSTPSKKVFGLQSYSLSTGEKERWRGEPYTSMEEGKYKTVIECTNDSSIKYPMCAHYFTDGYLRYKINYRAQYLENWKEIEEKTSALFKKFRIAAKNKQFDKVVIQSERIDRLLAERRNRPINPDFKPPQNEE